MKLPVGESDRTPRQPGYYRQASCPRRALHFKSGVPSAHIISILLILCVLMARFNINIIIHNIIITTVDEG